MIVGGGHECAFLGKEGERLSTHGFPSCPTGKGGKNFLGMALMKPGNEPGGGGFFISKGKKEEVASTLNGAGVLETFSVGGEEKKGNRRK